MSRITAEQMVQNAIQKKFDGNVSSAAKACSVKRAFLDELYHGTFRRRRKGRQNAKQDERYKKVAKGLDLNEATFLEAANNVQLPTPTPKKKRITPTQVVRRRGNSVIITVKALAELQELKIRVGDYSVQVIITKTDTA